MEPFQSNGLAPFEEELQKVYENVQNLNVDLETDSNTDIYEKLENTNTESIPEETKQPIEIKKLPKKETNNFFSWTNILLIIVVIIILVISGYYLYQYFVNNKTITLLHPLVKPTILSQAGGFELSDISISPLNFNL